ncbi:tetratricopeptide repeat protein [Virgibacillus kimchii]
MNTIMQAINLMESNQPEKAMNVLDNYLSQANEEEKYTIAEIYIQWGLIQEAIDILEALLQSYPQESELKVQLADLYTELEKDEEAINLLNEIDEEDPEYTAALVQLADLYQSQGLFEVAQQKLLTAKQMEPNEAVIDFALGELLFSTGEYNQAITYYEKVRQEMDEINYVSIDERLAEAYAAAGEYEKALTFYGSLESEDPELLFKYGLTAHQAHRNDIAIKAWEKVIESDIYYHTAYDRLAKVYEEEGMLAEAYETANKGLKVDEFNKELYYLSGVLAHKQNNEEESEKRMMEAIAIDPDYKEAILFLVRLLKNKDNFEGIIDLLVEIKGTGAEDPLYEWELAQAYNETESYNNALKHYKEAYNSLKADSEFLKEYGYFLTEEGRMKEAISVLRSYISLEPDDADTAAFLERMALSDEGE